MKSINWDDRYAYKGSMTIPPCSKYVYWNVLKTVYKIHSRHVKHFAKKLEDAGVKADGLNGNWREQQHGYNKDVFYIKSNATKLI